MTSVGAIQYLDECLGQLQESARALKCRPSEVPARIAALQHEKGEADKKLRAALTGGSSNKVADAVAAAVDKGAYKLVVARLDGIDGKEIRGAWDTVRDRLGAACACVLASATPEGKVALLAAGTDAAVAAGFKAGDVIRNVASLVGGRGGGKPTMAQAGGSDVNGIDEALSAAREMLEA
jgi:alanyl-tRNA synthetase